MFLTSFVVLAITLGFTSAAVTHYPPRSSDTNDLEAALNGTGAPGIFNSSETPDEIYGTYNWCNMPHVRAREYEAPAEEYVLKYVEVIQRHHKRTPYASNVFPREDITWDCSSSLPFYGLKNGDSDSTKINWGTYTSSQNPWSNTVSPGFVGSNCQFPQITSEGWEDSRTHGSNLREVYAPLLSLPSTYHPSIARVRVTNNVITSHVGSGLVAGLFPDSSDADAVIQPSGIDSLEPQLNCPKANALRNQYAGPNNANWTRHLDAADPLYDRLREVSQIPKGDNGGWHTSFDHYFDNLSAKQCHDKTLPCNLNDTNTCVSQEDTDTVYRLGQYEYSYIFRDAADSALYAALRFGTWFLELKHNLETVISGENQIRYLHNIAHDGSMSLAMGFLQIESMVWPGMGSELVFELYENQCDSEWFVRVLWSGKPMVTSTPLGTLDMIPVEELFEYIDEMVGTGEELYRACNSS